MSGNLFSLINNIKIYLKTNMAKFKNLHSTSGKFTFNGIRVAFDGEIETENKALIAHLSNLDSFVKIDEEVKEKTPKDKTAKEEKSKDKTLDAPKVEDEKSKGNEDKSKANSADDL